MPEDLNSPIREGQKYEPAIIPAASAEISSPIITSESDLKNKDSNTKIDGKELKPEETPITQVQIPDGTSMSVGPAVLNTKLIQNLTKKDQVKMFIQKHLPQKPLLALYNLIEKRNHYPVTNTMRFAHENLKITSATPNQKRLDQYMYTEARYMEWLSEAVETCKDCTVWEIGAAADGIPGILAHKRGARKVILFEPDPENANSLANNLANNNISEDENHKIVRAAVSTDDGKLTLRTSGVQGDAPQIVTTESIDKPTLKRTRTKDIEVDSFRMDTLAKTHGKPDIVIIDVEGAEESVLTGMGDLRPNDIFIEIHSKSAGVKQDVVLQKLSKMGYKIVRGYERGQEMLVQLNHNQE